MGDSLCSKIAIMQLFHELKQQFPALPDHIISQCIVQNSFNRQTCERSLREAQDLRPPLGKFPPVLNAVPVRSIVNQIPLKPEKPSCGSHRPASLDIQRVVPCETLLSSTVRSSTVTPVPQSSAAIVSSDKPDDDSASGFECNINNVACSHVNIPDTNNKKNSVVEIIPISFSNKSDEPEYSRSYTSVSLTLRPPSSEPQVPIEICSQGSSLTYTTSPLDPNRNFQSHLQICIGSTNPTSAVAARIKHPMNLLRPNTLTPLTQNTIERPPGLPTGHLNSVVKPVETMSAPTTPANSLKRIVVNSGSLPTTPITSLEPNSSISSMIKNQLQVNPEGDRNSSLNKVLTESQRQLIEKQLAKKSRLAQALQAEKKKLEIMKQDIRSFTEPEFPGSKDMKQKLRSHIYQLQLECDRLAKEIDIRSEQGVPLGETNKEFYRGIYTGQKIKRSASRVPPLPSRPPVWQTQDVAGASASSVIPDDDKEERLGPSWICTMCTFANHPLINACEQCNMPRFNCVKKPGETKDIHIRVTRRQNFPHRRTEHSWVV